MIHIEMEPTRPMPMGQRFAWVKNMREAMAEIGTLVIQALRRNAPVGTDPPDMPQVSGAHGHLRDDLRGPFLASGADSVSAVFSAPHTPYIQYVIKGTQGGTIIQPVAARALSFWAGERVFAMSVTRGSTRPNDFPRRAWEEVAPSAIAIFGRKLREAMAQGGP